MTFKGLIGYIVLFLVAATLILETPRIFPNDHNDIDPNTKISSHLLKNLTTHKGL